ncbi:MAG TPA: Calx-beta domain-containing protein [Solirubrobacteraceae bacterium]|jgi:hypothetical protein
MNAKVAAVLAALVVGVFAAPAAQAGPLPPDCSSACTSDGPVQGDAPGDPGAGDAGCSSSCTSDGPVQGDNPGAGDPGCAGACDSGYDPSCPPSGCDYGDDPVYQNPYPQPIECHEAHVDDERVSEADGKVTFRISASGSDPACHLKVSFHTKDGTAHDGADYEGVSGSVKLDGGDSAKVDVPILDDSLDEDDETFTLELGGDGHGSGEATIVDDDAPPSIAVGDASLLEGTGTGATAIVPVALSAASGQTVTVDYLTAPGTAGAGSDFTPVSGTLVFAPGETAKAVAVAIVGDSAPEQNETFGLALAAPHNATIAPSQGHVTIANDDAAPTTTPSHETHGTETAQPPAQQEQQTTQLQAGADAGGPAIGISQPAQKGSVVQWTVSCPASEEECSGSVRITLLPGAHGKKAVSAKKAKPIVLGVKRYRLEGGQKKKLRVKLNRRGRRLLHKRHGLKAKATFKTRDSSGNVSTRTQVLKLHEVAFRHN